MMIIKGGRRVGEEWLICLWSTVTEFVGTGSELVGHFKELSVILLLDCVVKVPELIGCFVALADAGSDKVAVLAFDDFSFSAPSAPD